jgi:hypothetical protein
MHPWWPGPERYGRLVDALLVIAAISPAIVWAAVSFGWKPVTFAVIEIVLIRLTVYRVLTGTFLE